MLGDGALTLREFVMREAVPLAAIHRAVLEFLQGRDDVALFGAHAVNAYVHEPRMTQDVDLVSVQPSALAEELREVLAARFGFAVRIRRLSGARGFRIYQIQTPQNRHLVDVRPVEALPPTESIGDVPVVAPAHLLAAKVVGYARRRGSPKSGTDWRDITSLLLKFPALKSETGPVRDCLAKEGASQNVLSIWQEFVDQEILPEEDDE